jgi:hypothetical protein
VPLTDADVQRAAEKAVLLLRRRDVYEPDLESELREVGEAWVREHPDGRYTGLWAAVLQYVKAEIWDGPLIDVWFNVRRSTKESGLTSRSDGYGGRA